MKQIKTNVVSLYLNVHAIDSAKIKKRETTENKDTF